VPLEAVVPPANQPFTVLCIMKVDKVEEGEELCNHAYHRLPQPHTPPAGLSPAHHWPESVQHAGGHLPHQRGGREREWEERERHLLRWWI
jgi:hypothetical protein